MQNLDEPNSGWQAIADLGTNTFQLLVGRWSPEGAEFRLRKKLGVGIGKKGMQEQNFHPEALDRALKALLEFAADLAGLGIHPSEARLFGTSAFRNARNAADFVARVQQETGFQIRIIDGLEEARLIFEGVRASGVLDPEGYFLLMDIGGGSVEFILCKGRNEVWKQSVEIGGLRLMEQFPLPDPLSEEVIFKIEAHLTASLQSLIERVSGLSEKPVLVGCSGSFETLVEMREAPKGYPLGFAEDRPFWVLTLPEFFQLFHQLMEVPLEERLRLPGMIPLRAGMMPVALVLIRLMLKITASPMVKVSTYSLKEGAFFDSVP